MTDVAMYNRSTNQPNKTIYKNHHHTEPRCFDNLHVEKTAERAMIMRKLRNIFLTLVMMLCIIGCSSEASQDDGIKMPDLVGTAMSEAVSKLEELGFTDVKVEKSDDYSDDSRFVVTSQSPQANTSAEASDPVKLTCMKQYDLSLTITSEKNLLFSKYDIDILYDNENIGSVDNGETFEKTFKALEGEHLLTVQKHKDDDMSETYKLNIKADTELSFSVSHDRNGVAIIDPILNEKEEVITRNTPAKEEPKNTPEPTKETEPGRPLSTDYQDAEDYHTVEVGSYEFKVPGNWIYEEPYFFSNEDIIGSIVYYNESDTEGFTEQDFYDTVDAFVELDNVLEVKENNKLYVNRIKMGHAVFTQDQDGFITTNTLFVFLDPNTTKSIVIMFMETDDSELDYSKDFDYIIHSIEPRKIPEKTMPQGTEFIFSTDELEYSDKETDPLQFISSNDESITFSTDDKLDLLKLGEQTIIYTAVLDDITTKVSHTFTVKDTKAPSIKLEEEKVTLKYGQEYDPYSNIKSVKDPVDGALKLVDRDPAKPGDGWYWLEGPEEIDGPGYYDYTVHACDKHGNTSSKSFSVTMKEQKKQKEEAPKYTYVLNTNTKKFHYPSCRDVSKIKSKNYKEWKNVTRDEVINAGYSPCGHCHP